MKVFVVTRHEFDWENGPVSAVRAFREDAQAFIAEREAVEPLHVRYPHGEWCIEEHDMPLTPVATRDALEETTP